MRLRSHADHDSIGVLLLQHLFEISVNNTAKAAGIANGFFLIKIAYANQLRSCRADVGIDAIGGKAACPDDADRRGSGLRNWRRT